MVGFGDGAPLPTAPRMELWSRLLTLNREYMETTRGANLESDSHSRVTRRLSQTFGEAGAGMLQ